MEARKCIFKYTLLILWGVTTALPIYADSPVWKVSKGKDHLYLGGTIHLLSQGDYPLPTAFDYAYEHSVQLILETDMQEMNSPEFQQAMLGKIIYAGEGSLEKVLKPKTYQALVEHLNSRGVPIANIVKFKPGIAAVTLTVIELQRLGLAGTGVDEFFSLRASKDKKTLGQLETAQEQLTFLLEMGEGREDDMIAHTLRDLKELPGLMQAMKEAWRRGDNIKLEEIALTPFKKDFPQIYKVLLVERNNAWMPQIEAMLKTADVELVLVGALHLVGDEGVLAQLSARGYKVQKL